MRLTPTISTITMEFFENEYDKQSKYLSEKEAAENNKKTTKKLKLKPNLKWYLLGLSPSRFPASNTPSPQSLPPSLLSRSQSSNLHLPQVPNPHFTAQMFLQLETESKKIPHTKSNLFYQDFWAEEPIKDLASDLENMNMCSVDGQDQHLFSSMDHHDNEIQERPETKHKIGKKIKLEENLSCHVCGDVASRHSYYGAQACHSCRAFFRRAIESGYCFAYVCAERHGYPGECKINMASRKKCQYCRYKACLAAGMKKSWVLNGEEKKKFLDSRKKKNFPVFKKPGPPPLMKQKNYISEEELLEVEIYLKLSGFFDSSKVGGLETGLVREIVRLVAFHQPLSEIGQNQLIRALSRRSRRFARKLGDSYKLIKQDQEILLAHNVPILLEMQICSFFHHELTWKQQLVPLLGKDEVDKMEIKLRELNVTELDTFQLAYTSMFPSSPYHSEKDFNYLLKNIGSWPQDAYEYVLLSLMLIFCPSIQDLTERRKIEELQTKFMILLEKYLNRKHRSSPGLAVSRLAGSITCMSRCKEMYLMHRTSITSMDRCKEMHNMHCSRFTGVDRCKEMHCNMQQ